MIVVILSKPKKFYLASWLIMKATGFPASHASIHVEGSGTLKGRVLVLEAVTHGVRVIPGDWWHAENEVVRSYDLVDQTEAGAEAYRRVWDESNVPYDFLGIVRFAFRLILRWVFGINSSYSPDTPKRLFCSELVARWLMALSQITTGEGSEPITIAPEMMAPGDLIPLMEEMGFFRESLCVHSSSATST